MLIKRILFPVDDSVHPRNAMEAIEMFHTLNKNLEVIILHVVDEVNNLIGNPHREELNAELRAAGEKLVAPFCEELGSKGIKCTVLIRHGRPATQILAMALKHHSDLIVMSPRGEGESGIEGLLLGSVSEKVLQHSRVPVLLSR